MSTAIKQKESFLKKEVERPLAKFRINAMNLLKKIDEEREDPIAKLLGIQVKTPITKAQALERIEELKVKIEESLNITERTDILRGIRIAKTWLETNDIVHTDNSDWTRPEIQIAFGFMLLLNEKIEPKEKNETKKIQNQKRILEERTMYALMCQGLVGNPKTKIGFGEPGTWFYYSPAQNIINMDIGQSLLLGLQNARAILLHEIGHSQITLGRSPKQEELRKILLEASKKKKIKKEEAIDLILKEREFQLREHFFQLAEDCAVNTYAEIEGNKTNQNVIVSALRNYTVMGVTRAESKAPIEKAINKATKTTTTPTPEKKEDPLKKRYNVVSNGFPLIHNWVEDDKQQWEIVDCEYSDEAKELLKEVINSEEGAAKIQPNLQLSPLEKLNKTTVDKATKECFEKRTKRFDEIFDKYFKPEMEKQLEEMEEELKKNLPIGEDGIEIEIEGEEGEGAYGDPTNNKDKGNGKNKEGEEEKEKKEGEEKEGEEEDKEEGKEEGKEKSDKNQKDPFEEIDKVLNEEAEKAKESAEQEKNRNQTQRQKLAQDLKETMKSSSAGLSPFEKLPENCSSYEEALEKCQEQIQAVTKYIKAISIQQTRDAKKEKHLLPDEKKGMNSLKTATIVNRIIKSESGARINIDDKKHFEHKLPVPDPAITTLEIFIDGSGSMCGANTKRTALTAIILREAAKRVDNIRVFAHFSGTRRVETITHPEFKDEKIRDVLGSLLTTGYGNGDNEIDNEAVKAAYLDIQKAPIPPKKMLGNTHFIFLTDGGLCGGSSGRGIKDEFVQIVDAVLSNKKSTFDIIITDGQKNTVAEQALKNYKTRDPKQQPVIHHTKTANEICKAVITQLMTQIKKNKSLSPVNKDKYKQDNKKVIQKLEDINM